VTWETLAAVAVGLALWLAAVWIWLWSASQWARIERHESKYGTVLYQPFAVLRSIPSFVGSIWILAGWAAFLDRVSPRILDRLPLPIGFVVLLWPMAVPAAIWLSGHPAVFVPPGARERQLGEAETRLNSSDQRRLDDLGLSCWVNVEDLIVGALTVFTDHGQPGALDDAGAEEQSLNAVAALEAEGERHDLHDREPRARLRGRPPQAPPPRPRPPRLAGAGPRGGCRVRAAPRQSPAAKPPG